MAKTELNSALRGISGAIDNWVYRNLGDRIVICRRGVNTAAPTDAQLAVRERFRLAADYGRTAKQDPALRAVYEAVAKAKGTSVLIAMMTDYLNPPDVNSVDLSSYTGRVGDPIRIRASKEAGVMAVNVAIRASDLTVLEEGAAVLQNGTWIYTAATAVPASSAVTITATAVDRPGNTGTKTVTFG